MSDPGRPLGRIVRDAARRTGPRSAAHPAGAAAARGGLAMAVAGVLGALAASSCCLVPFVLLALGVSGAWVGGLTALAAYQPIIVAVTLALLAAGFVLVHGPAPAAACAPGSGCATGGMRRAARIALWAAAVLVAAALVAPRVLVLFLGT